MLPLMHLFLCVEFEPGCVSNLFRCPRNFFKSYRKTDLQPNEVLVSVFVPFTRDNEFAYAYKQAKRREDDISVVTSGMRVLLEPTVLFSVMVTMHAPC